MIIELMNFPNIWTFSWVAANSFELSNSMLSTFQMTVRLVVLQIRIFKEDAFKFLFVEKADNVTFEKIVLPRFFFKFSSFSSSLKSTVITRQRNVISCFVIDLLEQGDFFQTFAFNQIIKLSCRHSEMTFISSFIFLLFLQQSPRCTELTSSGNLLSYTNRSFLSLVLFSKTFNKPFHYFSHYCKYSFPLNFKYCPQRL